MRTSVAQRQRVRRIGDGQRESLQCIRPRRALPSIATRDRFEPVAVELQGGRLVRPAMPGLRRRRSWLLTSTSPVWNCTSSSTLSTRKGGGV
jgi:hypothetical protein